MTLAATHTANLPALFRDYGISVAVTTYQAGKLVLIREQAGVLNTHFRSFRGPMGLALSRSADRLSIGTTDQIFQFRNVPALAHKLEPAGTHDACFLPRAGHFTGDVQIHEMAFGADDELWFVNTNFSCLSTIDPDSSFVPRWRPPFVTELDPNDRCHINGLAMVDGKPGYVTALGETNTDFGWRADKARGGLLMHVDSGEILCRRLSMPHSPRWHGGRLWACESGSGTLGQVDPAAGRYESIVGLSGFTRGLDFAGNLAFVGLSQVRETAVFSGIPITERLPPEDRICGVAVVDLYRGTIVGVIKFTSGVEEVFAVTVLPYRFPDLINDDEELLASSFVIPVECLGQLAPRVRPPDVDSLP